MKIFKVHFNYSNSGNYIFPFIGYEIPNSDSLLFNKFF